MSINTTVIYYDGSTFENITPAVYGNINYQKLIPANCSMYVSNGAGTAAKFIYVRPKYTSSADGTNTSEFTRILYLDYTSISSKTVNNGIVYYPYAYDLIGNKYVTAAFTFTQTYSQMPQTRGLYKAVIDNSNGGYKLIEATPISADVSNT
jgi:hypothetical protein